MSTLQTAENALLALLRGYSGGATFTASNSAVDDTSVMISQGVEYSLVVGMVEPTVEGENDYTAQGDYTETHRIAAWFSWKRGMGDGGDAQQMALLKALTEAVKDYARPYTRLNGTAHVEQARIVETSAPYKSAPRSETAAATHFSQRVIWEIQCSASFDAVE